MRTEQEIKQEIKRLKVDSRFPPPYATVDINAPLALIQLDLESQVATLNWVLKKKGN